MKLLRLIFTVLVCIILFTTYLGATPIVSSHSDSGDNAWNRLYLEIKNPDATSYNLADHSIEYYIYEPGMNISDLLYEIWDNGGKNWNIQVSFMEIIPAFINEQKKADIICRITFPDAATLTAGETIYITVGIRQVSWQAFNDEDDWSFHAYGAFEENTDILLFDSDTNRIAGDIPPFIDIPWKGAPIYWLGKRTFEEINDYNPREGDAYQSIDNGINYIYFEENWNALSRNPFSKTTTIAGGDDDPTWEITNKDGTLVFENFDDDTSTTGVPGLSISSNGDVIVNNNITSESGIFNTSIFLGQDPTTSPAAPFHIQNEKTECFLDTKYTDAIIEGVDGRLQLAAKKSGTFGASIILSTYENPLYTTLWLIAQKANTILNNRLSFNFGSLDFEGEFDVDEVISFGTGYSDSATLELKRYDGTTFGGSATAIRLSRLRSSLPNFALQTVFALQTEDTNQFIWSPIDGNSTSSGIYFASDEDAEWQSGNYPDNPNEIVFVGWGERKASISLRNGKANFKSIRTSEIILDTDYWADYVFEDKYEMMNLNEVEGYIEENGHLPGIPSAKEVAEKGISIGESQVKLLEKIEELTLYMIEQQKEITSLKADLHQLKNQTELKEEPAHEGK